MDDCEEAFVILCEIRADQHPELYDELPANRLDWSEDYEYDFNIFRAGWDAAMRHKEAKK